MAGTTGERPLGDIVTSAEFWLTAHCEFSGCVYLGVAVC